MPGCCWNRERMTMMSRSLGDRCAAYKGGNTCGGMQRKACHSRGIQMEATAATRMGIKHYRAGAASKPERGFIMISAGSTTRYNEMTQGYAPANDPHAHTQDGMRYF